MRELSLAEVAEQGQSVALTKHMEQQDWMVLKSLVTTSGADSVVFRLNNSGEHGEPSLELKVRDIKYSTKDDEITVVLE